MAFNPDEYLASNSGFDPDEYLRQPSLAESALGLTKKLSPFPTSMPKSAVEVPLNLPLVPLPSVNTIQPVLKAGIEAEKNYPAQKLLPTVGGIAGGLVGGIATFPSGGGIPFGATMVGGATMIGVDKKEKLINPKCKPGDAIVISKGPAIETTGLMAAYFPKFLEAKYGKAFVKKAQDVYYQMSTVKDALIAAEIGEVTAMHDATECGIFGGLYEMAMHSNVGMNINLEKIVLQDEVKKTCECFDIDPYKAISEGTLLVTVNKKKAKDVVKALNDESIPASIAGEVTQKKQGIVVMEKDKKYNLEHPKIDPFWGKFEEYLKKIS